MQDRTRLATCGQSSPDTGASMQLTSLTLRLCEGGKTTSDTRYQVFYEKPTIQIAKVIVSER